MFFIASKVLWFLAAPLNILLVVAFAGALLTAGRHARLARRIAVLAGLALLLIGILPLGTWLIEPLEDRFPPPPADMAAPYGIVVLGGSPSRRRWRGDSRNRASSIPAAVPR